MHLLNVLINGFIHHNFIFILLFEMKERRQKLKLRLIGAVAGRAVKCVGTNSSHRRCQIQDLISDTRLHT